MGLLSGLFGSAPKPPDPTKTAEAQWGYTQKAGDTTLKNNAMDRTGPFGSSEFKIDPVTGLPKGITSQFSGDMQGGVDNVTGAFGTQSGALPSGVDFTGLTDTGDYLNAGMSAYDQATAGTIGQGQNRINQEIANRGIPINDKIATDLQGNFDQQNATARAGEFARLYGMTPGMRATDTNTAVTQGMAPGQLTGQSLGLLQGASGLLPQAQQPQASYGAPDYAGLVNNNYAQQVQAYGADKAGLGNLLKGGAALVSGGGLGGLFNNPASKFSP